MPPTWRILQRWFVTLHKVGCTFFNLHFLVGAVSVRSSAFGNGTGPIFFDELHCSGLESNILECESFQPLGLHRCDHGDDAGVMCSGRKPQLCIYSALSIIVCYFSQLSLLDINECDSMDNGGCEHLCNNTIGSFFCFCILGYRLDGNGFNCSGGYIIYT